MGPPHTDDELLRRARDGDHDAYGEVVRRHQEIAFRTAVLITRNATEAEDATQEAFVKAWSALDRFRAGEPLRPWLLAIVANEARDRLRAGGRRDRLVLRAVHEQRSGSEDSPEAAVLAGERRSALLEALARLREDDRLVIGCRHLLDMSEAETAAALDVAPGTVKSRLSRALERLREEVGDARA